MLLKERLIRGLVRDRRVARRCAAALERVAAELQIPQDALRAVVLADHGESLEILLHRLGQDGAVDVISAAHAVRELKTLPRLDALIDVTSRADRVKLFQETFWALKDGGQYVAVNAGGNWSHDLQALLRANDEASVTVQRRRQELIDSMASDDGEALRKGDHVVVKQRQHHAILRHSEVEPTLGERFGDGWGETLATQEPYEYVSRADIVMHGRPSDAVKQGTIVVPKLSIRTYNDVTCHMREIVTRDNLILPDTYRHWQSKALFHKRIWPASGAFGRLDESVLRRGSRRERGVFYSLDSAFPAHFGHLMTETISKYWGWDKALAVHPGIRPVMTHQSGRPALPAWKADVLRALEIPVQDILFVRSGESVAVDGLVAAMPQLVNPHYVDLNIRETWEKIAHGVGADPSVHDRPEKIFLSRRGQKQRACTNTDEVEAFFASQGFAILSPEDLSFAEQVYTFARARVIAGFGGSALFNAMFNSKAKVLVLSSRSYVAANEYLIASANGNELHYFWAPPLIEQPDAGFSVDAYRSGFEFPLSEHSSALRAAMS